MNHLKSFAFSLLVFGVMTSIAFAANESKRDATLRLSLNSFALGIGTSWGSGTLTYKDEFHVAMTDSEGWSKSWPVSSIDYKIDSPSDAHIEQFEKYTDDDIHNLMAYLQTLR